MTQTVPGLDLSTTRTVTETLRAQPEHLLEFWLSGEPLVPPGYHVTEIKAVSVEAMDCGGRATGWRETVIQLMDGSAQDAAGGHMPVRKFLAIYDRVTQKIPVRGDAEVRFEYGNAARPALQYHVAHLEPLERRLIVHLRAPGVQCKAGDACGQPATGVTQAAPAPGRAPDSGCCTPGLAPLMTLE